MATIETAEGQTLIVENSSRKPRLRVNFKVSDADGFTREFDETMFSIYNVSANPHSELRPRSRGDLTAEAMEDLINRIIGWVVGEGVAPRRSDVDIEEVEVYEHDDASRVRQARAPEWDDDWPEDGTMSDQVRFMLDYDTYYTDEEIAVTVGCSRSLVTDIKKKRSDED